MNRHTSSRIASRIATRSYALAIIALVMVIGMALPVRQALAGTVTYKDTDNEKRLEDPGTRYVIQGDGTANKGNNHFTVPSNCSSERSPIRVTLKDVNVSQDGQDPRHAFITIEEGNYVIISLDGTNRIVGGESEQTGDDNGMAAINVDEGSTLKITSASGDGSTNGKLVAKGGGGKHGGAAIGSNYHRATGGLIIAGGTIEATGGNCAAGIGGGRDSEVRNITITGGRITAQGGDYGAGIGAGDNYGSGDGGDLWGLTISGGEITATGGTGGAGIGGGEGSNLRGNMLISGGTIEASGGAQASGIGAGQHGAFMRDASNKDYTLKITGGVINAQGGENGAGIGGGDGTTDPRVLIDQANAQELRITAKGGANAAGIGGGNSTTDYVGITLRGGTISATGGDRSQAGKRSGAGIGGGGDVGRIEIKGSGTIEAYGGLDGAGIGGGENGSVTDHLTIDGDTDGRYGTRGQAAKGGRGLNITAIASKGDVDNNRYDDNEAAAIGGGRAGNGNITVKNAVIKSCAHHEGADIGGGGFHGILGGTIDTVEINNCDIQSSSFHKVTSAIGSGYGGTINNIKISNTKFNGGGIGASLIDVNDRGLSSIASITIDNSDIHAHWDEVNPGVASGNADVASNFRDHGAAGIGSGQYGGMDTITITNSKIYAHGFGSGAGIGGGGQGGHTTWAGFEKASTGDVGTITISGSDVEAVSGYGDFADKSSIKIGETEMELADLGSGAGIGSGAGSGVEVIDIHDCGTVNCRSFSGAGIGGGCGSSYRVAGWVNHIYLDNCKDVDARGGGRSAGIGTGGGDGLRDRNSCMLQEVYINDCPDVYAQGGKYSAGIGCAMYSTFDAKASTRMGAGIAIHNSDVVAYGGAGGAGIGGGARQSVTGFGGDSPSILIKGRCRVDAYGGGAEQVEETECPGGAAGIGGGADGGSSSPITIDVTEDETTPKGELDNPAGARHYVHAEGKDGGAGIGSGGAYSDDMAGKGSNDFDNTITIKGGAVFARGGGSYAITSSQGANNDLYIGAGAGIGGGSGGGTVDSVTISGGFIIAEAGEHHATSDYADDIGSGGDWSSEGVENRNQPDGRLLITGGTVLCDTIGDFEDRNVIIGGSVRANIRAYSSGEDAGVNVYRHPAKLVDSPRTKVSVKTWHDYGTNSIYTDGNYKVYLYLQPKGDADDKGQWADITVGGEARHYYGYTAFDDTTHQSTESAIKLNGGKVSFKEPSEAHYGEDFELELDDGASTIAGASWTFTATGAACVKTVETSVSPGAKLKLHGDAVGSYTVTGTSSTSVDPEIYWNSEATFTGTTKRGEPRIDIVEALDKEYDGSPVENPAVSTNSTGKVTYAYYDQNDNQLGSKPVNAGTYKVVATVAKTSLFAKGSDELTFTIRPRKTACTLEMAPDPADDAVTVFTATVYGLIDADGTVRFKYTHNSTETTTDPQQVKAFENGEYGACFEVSEIDALVYTVQAIYTPSDKGNYASAESAEETGYKDYSNRQILDEQNSFQYVRTYGDDPFPLTLTTNHSTSEDRWRWGVISDLCNSDFGDQHAVSIAAPDGSQYTDGDNMPSVTIKHAGAETIRVSLTDSGVPGTASRYHTAYHDVNISVLPKYLYLTTPSATKVYDGQPLSAEGSYQGLVDGETLVFETTGERTIAGSSTNSYVINWTASGTTAKQANYSSIDLLGRLTVLPAPTTVSLELAPSGQDDTQVGVTATIGGLVAGETALGTVTFVATQAGASDGLPEKVVNVEQVEDKYTASATFDLVPADGYVVTATYAPGSNNYCPSETTVGGTQRAINCGIDSDSELLYMRSHRDCPYFVYKTTYGDGPFDLKLATDKVGDDTWTYEVTRAVDTNNQDSINNEPVRIVDVDGNGRVTIEGAGTAIIRANVHDTTGAYADVTTYVVVHVDPAPYLALTGSVEKTYDGELIRADGALVPIEPGASVEDLIELIDTTMTELQSCPFDVRLKDGGDATFSVIDKCSAVFDTSSQLFDWRNSAMKNYDLVAAIGQTTIWPGSTTVDLKLSQGGSSATATIGGLHGETGTVGTVTFSVNGTPYGNPVSVKKDASGAYSATMDFNSVPEGDYTVTATFTPNGGAADDDSLALNYLESTAQVIGHKGRAQRTILGERVYHKTYGDDNFSLGLSLAQGERGPSDTWSYEIIYDSRNIEALGLGPSIDKPNTNSGSANVAINHAGKVVVRVTVADGRDQGAKVWKDATAYVVVDIAPAQLRISSFAYDEHDASKIPVDSVRYGLVDTLAFGLQFEGLISSDGPSTFTTVNGTNHGTLEAMKLISTIGASDTPYQVGIARIAPEGENAGPFFSCNYDIVYDTTTHAVKVTKAPLAVRVLDADGVSGGVDPEYGWGIASNQSDWNCTGLKPWDTAENIFVEEPTVAIDPKVTGGKTFKELDARTYENALVLSDVVSQNYDIYGVPGNLVVSPADLSDTNRFSASVQNATYSALAQDAQVAVVDNAFDGGRTLEQDTQYQVVYLNNHTDAGTALIGVIGMGGNYTGRQILGFEISKATARVNTDSASKVYDGTALTAPGENQGILDADQYAFATTGTQTDPGSSRNTYELNFSDASKANNYAVDESLGHLVVASDRAESFFVSDVVDYTYDGTEHKQAVTVRNQLLQELVEGKDYSLAYEGDLVNAGTVTIVIKGAGAYTGSATRTYQIKPAHLLVHTFSDAKAYDGAPLVGEGEVWRLVGDETVTLTVTGTQTEVGSSPNTYTLTWDGTAKESNYEVLDNVGTLTVLDPDTLYYCASGANGTWSAWTKGSTDPLVFVFKRIKGDETTFDHFAGIEIDGHPVSTKGYTARRGSVVVSLLASYLETLSVGNHTLTAKFDDGDPVSVVFTILAAESSPDNNGGGRRSSPSRNNGSTGSTSTSGNDGSSGSTSTSGDTGVAGVTSTSGSNGGAGATSTSGDTGVAGVTSTQSRRAVPQTGDSTPMALWTALALAALGMALCGLSARARRV